MISGLFIEALNSIFGLLLLFYCLLLYRSYKNSMFHRGFKYLIVVALLISLREATYLFSFAVGISVFRDLVTSLTILALTYSIVQFKEQTVSLVSSVKDRKLSELIGLR